MNMARVMMVHGSLSSNFSEDALLLAAYILTRVPSISASYTPYELWTANKAELTYLRPWRSAGYHMTIKLLEKLDPKSKKCIFIRSYEDVT